MAIVLDRSGGELDSYFLFFCLLSPRGSRCEYVSPSLHDEEGGTWGLFLGPGAGQKLTTSMIYMFEERLNLYEWRIYDVIVQEAPEV